MCSFNIRIINCNLLFINTITEINNKNGSPESFSDAMSQSGIKITTRPITSHSIREKLDTSSNIADNVIQENGWSLNQMVERPNFIGSYPWATTDASHVILKKLRVPTDLLTNNITRVPFNSFKYWKGTIKMHIQVTATPLHQGLLAAVYIPMTTDESSVNNILSNFSSLSVNQVCYLYANTNTSATLDIPFNTPLHYLDIENLSLTDAIGSLGYVYIVVINPLQAAVSATTTVDVSIFSQLENNSFKLPRFTQPLSAQSIFKKAIKSIVPPNIVHDTLDAAFNFLGLDKPTDMEMQKPSKPLGTAYLNAGDGIEFIDKMCVFPSKINPVTSDTFATTNDEMAMEDLKKRYTYLGTFSQGVSQVPGTVLANVPISPCPVPLFRGQSNKVPLLSYLSYPFNYWKGGLTYKIQVISTSFQTTKIFFAFNYGTFLPTLTTPLNLLTGQYGEAFEINQGSNEFEFTVPYISKFNQLYVPNTNNPVENSTLGMLSVVVLNSLVAPNNTPTTIYYNMYIAGADDYELSTLSARNDVLPIMQPPDSDSVDLEAQSATAPLMTDEVNTYKEESTNVAAPNFNVEHRQDISEKSMDNIRHYLRKYQLAKRFKLAPHIVNSTTPPDYRVIDILDLFNPKIPNVSIAEYTANGGPSRLTGLMGYYAALYRMFKGPVRFKLAWESTETAASFSVFYVPPFAVSSTYTTPLTGIEQYVESALYPSSEAIYTTASLPGNDNFTRIPISFVNSIQKTAEFEIPYNSLFKCVLTRNNFTESYLLTRDISTLGYLVLVPHDMADANVYNFVNVNVFVALGDESRFGTIYNVPYVVPNFKFTGTTVSSVWPDDYNAPTNSVFTLTQL
jgi:hypothetical protein